LLLMISLSYGWTSSWEPADDDWSPISQMLTLASYEPQKSSSLPSTIAVVMHDIVFVCFFEG
jgi:hypothetical protein